MFYLIYPFFVLATLAFTLLTYVLSPILPAFMDKDGNLPKWLSWFQTFDNTLLKGRSPEFGWTGSDWWIATEWLCRNPGYTFDYYPLGCAWDQTQWTVKKNTPSTFYAIGPSGHFCYTYGSDKWQIKLGWKAWASYDRVNNKWTDFQWGPAKRIPFCFTVKPIL